MDTFDVFARQARVGGVGAIIHKHLRTQVGVREREDVECLTGFEQYFGRLLLNSVSGCLELTLGFLLTDLHDF